MSATIIDLSNRRDFRGVNRVTSNVEAAAIGELRRARLRIAQLERNLTQAMRDSLSNYNRARDAELRLREAVGGHEPAA